MTTSTISKDELKNEEAAPALISSSKDKSAPVDRNRVLATRFTYAFTFVVSILFLVKSSDKAFLDECVRICQNIPNVVQVTCGTELIISPLFFLALGITFALEKYYPAREGEGTFSRTAYLDSQWAVPKFIIFSSTWLLYIALLRAFYNQHLGFLTIHAVDNWPEWSKFAVGFVWVDFLRYISHYARHKVQTFWTFHAVHHSQKNLNFFTEWRSHIFDDVLKYTIEAIPLFMLDQSFVQVLLLDRTIYWYSAIYHGNIRSNYGWLKHFLVTPQYHRLHHSIHQHHRDCNFGLVLTVWDRMFGTMYKNFDEYPATGTEDEFFPYEDENSSKGYSRTFFDQFFYPFKLPKFRS